MLEPRQAAFVQHYLANGMNGTQAALKAGYSEASARTTASKLLTKSDIREAIEAGKNAVAVASGLERDWLVNELVDEFRAAREPIIKEDKDGKTQIVMRASGSVARLAELLARMHGWIDDKPAAPQQLVNLIIQR